MFPVTYVSQLWLLLGASVLVAGDARSEGHTDEFSVEPGGVLVLEFDDGGSAEVVGWDRNVARVTYYADCNDLDDYDIEMTPSDEGLEINAGLVRRRNSTCLHFEIRVPTNFDVEFQSAGGGLELEDLEGRFGGRTGGGELTLRNVKGTARLRTGGGEMEVVDSELDGKIETGGGEVRLENLVGDLDAYSGGGEVRYVNVRDQDGRVRGPSGPVAHEVDPDAVLIANAGGSIRVPRAPAGASVSTGGGDITVRRASKFVIASTGGGDVRVEIASGSVDARTGAGRVEVAVESDSGGSADGDVTIVSGLGDIELTLPSGFSGEFDLTIGYTRNSRRDYEIDSAFELREERTDEWEYEGGHRASAKKFIYGTGSLNGGRHRVEVRTTNGDIRIRKWDG